MAKKHISENCSLNLELEEMSNEDIIRWQGEARTQVESVVGFPVDRSSVIDKLIKKLEKAERGSKRVKLLKAQLNNEKKRYNEHKKLYDLILNRILDVGAKEGYLFDVKELTDMLDLIQLRHYGVRYNDYKKVSPSRVRGFHNLVKKLFKQQDTFNNKGMFNSIVKLFDFRAMTKDPIFMSAMGDKTGRVSNLIKKLYDLQSDIFSKSKQYTDKHQDTIKEYVDNLNLILNELDDDQLDALNFEADSILDIGAGESSILKRNWRVPYFLNLKRTEEESAGWNNLTTEQKRERLVDSYGKLLRRMMNGEVRQIEVMSIPSEYIENDKGVKVYNPKFKEFFESEHGQLLSEYIKKDKELSAVEKDEDGETIKGKESYANIHIVKHGDIEYRYATIRDPETNINKLYLLKKTDTSQSENTVGKTIKYFDGVQNDFAKDTSNIGYDGSPIETENGRWETGSMIEANDHTHFNYETETGQAASGFIGFTLMKSAVTGEAISLNDNFNKMISKPSPEEIKVGYLSMHDAMIQQQDLYKELFNDLRQFSEENDILQNQGVAQAIRVAIRDENNKRKVSGEPKMTEDEIDNFIEDKSEEWEQFVTGAGLEVSMFVNKDGALVSGTSVMSEIQEYYDFHQYDTQEYEERLEELSEALRGKFDATNKAIDKHKVRLIEDEITQKEYDNLEEELKGEAAELRESMDEVILLLESLGLGKADPEILSKQLQAHKAIFAKHRTQLMNPLKRKLGSDIVVNYIQTGFGTLLKNDIKGQFLNLYPTLGNKNGNDVGAWLLNRVKLSLGDVRFEGAPVNYETVANAWNKIKTMGGRNSVPLDAEDIHKMSVMFNMFSNANLLGMKSAITNLSQQLNLAIQYDFNIMMEAKNILSEEARNENGDRVNVADEIAKRAGVIDFLDAFNEFLAGGLGNNNKDAWNFLLNYKDLYRLFRFDKKGLFRKKETLVNLKKSGMIDDMLRRMSGMGSNADIDYLRKMYVDILEELMKPVPKDKKAFDLDLIRLKKKARKLNSSLKMESINRLAAWKLKYQDPAGAMPTFTHAETEMRRLTAVIGALMARKLGQTKDAKNAPSATSMEALFMSENALVFARNAVNNTMFGMSPSYLPFMFAGLGRNIFQYKSYSYNQFQFEKRIWQNYWNSLEDDTSALRGSGRLLNPFYSESIFRGIKIVVKSLSGRKLSAKEEQMFIDSPDTMSVMTWFGRAAASISLAAMETGLPLFNYLRPILARQGGGVYGFESPMVTWALRLMLAGYYTNGDEEDDDKRARNYRALAFLIFSPMFTLIPALWNTMTRLFVDNSDDEEGIFNESLAPIGLEFLREGVEELDSN